MPQPSHPVRAATLDDLPTVTEILAEAFLHGDLGPWLIAHVDVRQRVYYPYFAMLAEHAIEYGQVEITAGGQAVAVWHPVAGGRMPEIRDYDLRLAQITGGHLPRFAALDREMCRRHPEAWHHYLAFLAVHPDAQHAGRGSALLAHHHALLDEAGTPAFLEATGARTRDLYHRHGYLPREPYRIDGSPMLYPMWRPPAPVSGSGSAVITDRWLSSGTAGQPGQSTARTAVRR